MATPEPAVAVSVDAAEHALVDSLAVFLICYQRAAEAGVDAQAVVAVHLREAMGEAWNELPPMVRMLLG